MNIFESRTKAYIFERLFSVTIFLLLDVDWIFELMSQVIFRGHN